MRTRHIGILSSSPIINEGLTSILKKIEGGQVTCGPWEDDQQPEVVVTDPFRLSECPEGSKKVGILGGAVPKDLASKFDDTLTIYDEPADICGKVTSLLASETEETRGNELSPREKEVILLVVKGFSNKEIASQMNVSVNTVMTHRRNIASKLKIHSPAGLTIFAIATGLVKMDDITD